MKFMFLPDIFKVSASAKQSEFCNKALTAGHFQSISSNPR